MMRTRTQVLDRHLERYPLLRAEDIYKLAHQGVYGPGHIIDDPNAARDALECEFLEVRKRCCLQAVDAIEELDPDDRIIRVNLAPLRDIDNAVTLLLSAMLESAATIRGDAPLMHARLTVAVDWCRTNVPDQHEQLKKLADEAESTCYAARHHSRVYATAYRPAYRVVLREAWNKQNVDAAKLGDPTCAAPPE